MAKKLMTSANRPAYLSLTTQAPLDVVAASNYLRYGPLGVRRFGPGTLTDAPKHPRNIRISLSFKTARGDLLHKIEALTLSDAHPETPSNLEGSTQWHGEDSPSHLRALWLWDMYRLTSFLRVGVELSPPDSAPQGEWAKATQAIKTMQAGDKLLLTLQSLSGEMLQIYSLEEAAGLEK